MPAKPKHNAALSEPIGDRGERIFELAVTNYKDFTAPLFKPGFLGAKWPAIDYYVELLGARGATPFFFAQIKTTAQPIAANATALEINAEKKKCEQLFKIPGPTYLVGVHEPTEKAYILSVHNRPTQGVYRIPLNFELTSANLRVLHQEVCNFWKSFPNKPTESHFK